MGGSPMIVLGLVLLAAMAAADEPEPLWFAGHRSDGYWGVDWAIYQDHTWAKVASVHAADLPRRGPGPVPEWSSPRERAQAAARRSGLVVGAFTDERWADLLRDVQVGEAQIAERGRFGHSYTANPLLLVFILTLGGRESRLWVVDPIVPTDNAEPWRHRVGLPEALTRLTSSPGGEGWGTPRRVVPVTCHVSLFSASGGLLTPLIAWPDDLGLPRPAAGQEGVGVELAGESCAALRERAAGGLLHLGTRRWDVVVQDRLPREAEMQLRLQSPPVTPPER